MSMPDATNYHARMEAAAHDEDARQEYGRTLTDALRFLKRAKRVRLWVRRGLDDDALIIDITPSAFRTSTKNDKDSDPMPCQFDPDNRKLSIGSIHSIYKARENAS